MSIIKKITALIIGIFIAIFIWQYFTFSEEVIFINEEEIKVEDVVEQRPQKHTFLFTGDIMLDRGVKYMIKKHGEDYTFPFLKMKEVFDGADILFGNLESMISDKGRDVGGKYSFRANPEAVEGLVYAGFDVVTLANNHAFDWGREAFDDTMKRLQDNNIYTLVLDLIKKRHTLQQLLLWTMVLVLVFWGTLSFYFHLLWQQVKIQG